MLHWLTLQPLCMPAQQLSWRTSLISTIQVSTVGAKCISNSSEFFPIASTRFTVSGIYWPTLVRLCQGNEQGCVLLQTLLCGCLRGPWKWGRMTGERINSDCPMQKGIRKVNQVLQESKRKQTRENQGEFLDVKAQLKCPQGHVGVSHARRKRRDIQSRGDTVFRGIQSRQRITRSSLYLKVGGLWESRKGGWDNPWEPGIYWWPSKAQVRVRMQRTKLRKDEKHSKTESCIIFSNRWKVL